MARTSGTALLDHFSAPEDPRQAGRRCSLPPARDHPPAALRHVGRGGRLRRDPALWGHQNLAFLRRFRPHLHGIPSHDTSGEVMRVARPRRS